MKFLKLKKKEEREVKRVTEYIISGGAFFWTGYIILVALNHKLGPNLLWLSTSISYTVGWIVNYLLQRYWVFNNPRLEKYQTEVTSRYLIISVVNLILNFVIIEQLWKLFELPVEISSFVAAGFFTIWNYLWYKLWVFPDRFSRKSLIFKPVSRTKR